MDGEGRGSDEVMWVQGEVNQEQSEQDEFNGMKQEADWLHR